MLHHLHISNYALISKLDIEFEDVFSVITGETGAGKSIILGALGLLCGQRADTRVIQTGAKKCCVEAVFHLNGLHLESFFKEKDIDFDGCECIVRREVYNTGKSRAFLNDIPVQLIVLKELSGYIIDIHSQHRNLLLGRESFLIDTLDGMARNESVRQSYQQTFSVWKQAQLELKQLKEQVEKDRADAEFIQFQLQQLEAAALQADEQEELEQEAETLSHAEEIKQALFQVAGILSKGDATLTTQMKTGTQALEAIARFFPAAETLAQRLESTRIELEDIADEMERSKEYVDFDPARQSFVEERLDTIYSLEKKHHVASIGELLQIQTCLAEKLQKIENFDDFLQEKEEALVRLQQDLDKYGEELTNSRKKAAKSLEEGLISQLKELGMPHVKLCFEFLRKSVGDQSGFDSVTFLFSSNKGAKMQDVSQIASGGEIARLMLSLKAQMSQNIHLPTIIFDEIDTGVSGTMAEKMANVMRQMSKHCQVICITHLPQIAAAGERHYRVYKEEDNEQVQSHICRLMQDERVAEIAQMLSGEEMTEAAINNAKSLLKLY